jgi:hypothetical protein
LFKDEDIKISENKTRRQKTQIERRGTSGFDLAIKSNRTVGEALTE